MKKWHKATFKLTGMPCPFCGAIPYIGAFAIAIQEKIPLIFTGASPGQLDITSSFQMPDQEYQKKQLMRFYNSWEKFFSISLAKHEPFSRDEILNDLFSKLEPYVQIDSKVDFYPVIVPLSSFVNWFNNMNQLKKVLQKQIGWEEACDAEKKTVTHTSCRIEVLRGYFEAKRKLTALIDEISFLIRNGGITREQGLKEFKAWCFDGSKPAAEDIAYFCNFLEISAEEFEHYFARKMPFFTKLRYLGLAKDLRDMFIWIAGAKGVKKGRYM
jgi:hypothetical protein